jgi:hypothetical protein
MTERAREVEARLRTDASEIEACGAGNEAARMREAAALTAALGAKP